MATETKEPAYEVTTRDGDVLITHGGISLAEFYYGPYAGDGLQRANEFVRAVNSHAALVKALELMLESHGMHGPCKHNNCSDCRWAQKKAEAALTQAKEGK